jgi:hypothetical protein
MKLAKTWPDADLARRQESQNALFLEGLGFSNQVLLFEPGNRTLMASVSEMWAALETWMVATQYSFEPNCQNSGVLARAS